MRTINDTKIKYLLVADAKIYQVVDIDFSNMTMEAIETDFMIDDVIESELWDISYFEDFKVRLLNRKGEAKIINFTEWRKKRDVRCN